MKIGIDATSVSGSIVGHSSYVGNLILKLISPDAIPDAEWLLYCRKAVPIPFQNLSPKVKFKISNFKNRKLCEQLWLSATTPFDSLDLFHSTWSLPMFHPKQTVLTLHGLASYLYPHLFTKSYRLYWKLSARRNYSKATRYIAISQATKNDFIEHMKIPEEKIDVVHHGIDTSAFSRIEDKRKIKELRKKYSLPVRYLLYVGAIMPVKNLPTLIKAYSILQNISKFKDIGLVIAGVKGWDYEPVFRLPQDLKIADKVIFTGFFPQEDLPTLYSAAELFAFPSYYEGFGIPLLEAFACETPVITSNTSCLPEVAGDAAVLIDPRRPEELTDGMEKIVSDEGLQRSMIQKGKERLKEFSWEKTAHKTFDVYKKILSNERERNYK